MSRTDEMPAFDGIGANEFIVDVTHPGAVDFISAVDTPYPWELNIWYHTLNCGFRTRISGETDFPCINGERVGAGRTYAKLDAARLSTAGWRAVRDGRTYVSDGFTHLMDFSVNGVASGADERSRCRTGGTAHVSVQVAALLDPVPTRGSAIARPDEKPYWTIERARVGDSREIPVELDGQRAARSPVRSCLADGVRRPVTFEVPIPASAWIAAAGPRPRAHQPDLRHRRGQADPCFAAQRGMVPRGCGSVLDAEGREHPASRARGRGARLRPRPGGVPAPHRGIDTTLTRYPLPVIRCPLSCSRNG